MRGRVLLGIILTLVAIGLILDRAGHLDLGDAISTYWPSLLIFIGLLQLVTRAGIVGPLILVTVGLFFQLARLDILPTDWGTYVWPAILLVVGLWLLLGGLGWRRRKGVVREERLTPAVMGRHEQMDEDRIDRFVAFGGLDAAVMSRDFRGGSVTVAFGGAEVDLSAARPAPGAKLELVALFGGIVLKVPAGWQVHVKGTPLFGGVENKMPTPDPDTPRLEVVATAIFGGVTVRPPKVDAGT